MHIHDSRMTCEVCGNTGHSGNNCPKTQEDVNIINNNNYCPQQNQGWNQQQRPNYQGNYQGNNYNNFNNQPSVRDLVSGQAKFMEVLENCLSFPVVGRILVMVYFSIIQMSYQYIPTTCPSLW